MATLNIPQGADPITAGMLQLITDLQTQNQNLTTAVTTLQTQLVQVQVPPAQVPQAATSYTPKPKLNLPAEFNREISDAYEHFKIQVDQFLHIKVANYPTLHNELIFITSLVCGNAAMILEGWNTNIMNDGTNIPY
ncbi:hypothetical protein FRB99_002644 [Tulasnella sp. 403]|nr:hypothetical protein FRB99_002644 [Tulasnella sp. 403]